MYLRLTKSIRNELTAALVLLIVVAMALENVVVQYNVSKQTKIDYTNSVRNEVVRLDEGLNSCINTIEENTNMVANLSLMCNLDSRLTSYIDKKGNAGMVEMTPLQNSSYEADIYKEFENIGKTHNEIENIFVGAAENGGYVQYPASARKEGYDARTREWYKGAIAKPNEVVITDAYITSKGDVAVSVVTAVKDGKNNVKGVVGIDVKLNVLASMVSKIKIGQSGYVMLVDKNGTILANPKNPSSVNKKIDSLNIQQLKDINKVSAKTFDTKLEDGKIYAVNVYKSTNDKLNWNYVYFMGKDDFAKTANSIGIIAIIALLITVAAAVLLAFKIANRISAPIKYFEKHLGVIGAGDFTEEIPEVYLKNCTEIGGIAKAIQQMQNCIKEMIINVKENSVKVEEETEKLFVSADELATSSNCVADAIKNVATGTSAQTGELVQISDVLGSFGLKVQLIVDSLKEVNESSKDINSMASESGIKMQNLIDSIMKINESFKEFVNMITSLGSNIQEINQITKLINNIAEQTNLLALNAAIEAARAGESGRGFSVVAEEIRKLAEQSKDSVESINKLINGISQETGAIVKNTSVMDSELGAQTEVINEAIETFNNIILAVEGVTPKIASVNKEALKMNSEKENILNMVENASEVSEQVAASSEEIAASSQEMNAITNEVAQATEKLNNMTQQMLEQVNNFKI